MRKFLALILIAILLISAIGCMKKSQTQVKQLEDNMEVPENDITIPEETLSTDIDASEEPDFGSVI